MSIPGGAQSLPAPRACLIILDGWGLAPDGPGNAVSLSDTPVFDELWASYPHTTLTACGPAVGLPEGQMGNSEVGHLNLGAGAVVRQDLMRIDESVADGQFDENEVLSAAFKESPRTHLIGLVSDGGVHSSLDHLRALIALGGDATTGEVIVHAFTDGRDTLPRAGVGYLQKVDAWCKQAGNARVGSVIGRYWAMDRDSRWDRVQKATDLMLHGNGEFEAESGAASVQAAHDRDETDEFILPTSVGADTAIKSGDSFICFNFRPDRMREIVNALANPEFTEVDRRGAAPASKVACMTEYVEGWPYPVAFPPHHPDVTLSSVVAAAGLKQLHGAETEKYPHVTYFFNGGAEAAYDGERREMVQSPRDVATYDLKPAMSGPEAAEAFVGAWNEDGAAFGIINFANADMVGHTGSIPAAVEAIETVDRCLGEVVAAVHASGGVCVVTADHGNADNMLEPDGSPNTAHSLNPVPLIVTTHVDGLRDGGILADVAPTVLNILGVSQPVQMTGVSLIKS
ncbi:MAG: 2,3-bisphosphoglycerate-independent phosphoglycerate mutase [Solirubrobacterales bacterium]|nr:2,3-bisphosphoglycerate-independent phosphoglycerate mutase [Solirubrobacterales bacterium]